MQSLPSIRLVQENDKGLVTCLVSLRSCTRRSRSSRAERRSRRLWASTIRGFDVDSLAEKPGWFARLFGAAKPLVKFLQGYEEVRGQIDKITTGLEKHKYKLLVDIESLDRLYDANLDYFQNLGLYIAAGEEKIRVLDAKTIPASPPDYPHQIHEWRQEQGPWPGR